MQRQTIAVLNQKGGVGKTTTAVNLGVYLAKAGRGVLLVDFDPQGNATSGLGVDKEAAELTSYEIINEPSRLPQAIRITATPRLSLLPANASLAAAEVELVAAAGREQVLRRALAAAEQDFVIIDCPPALSLLTINALAAADQLLVPVQAEYYALEGLSQLLSVVQRVRDSGLNPQLELLGLLVTMFDKRTSLSEQVWHDLQTHFGATLFETVIPRNVRLAEAPSYGQSIAEYDKWSKGARAYKQLAKEVLERVGSEND